MARRPGLLPGHRVRDHRAVIAALCDVALVAEALHKHVPGAPDPLRTPSRFAWLAREAIAGDRGDDHVEGVLGPAAVSFGMGERADRADHFQDGARPAVGHEQRQCVGVARTDVNEMDVHPVDLGDELRQGVQAFLQLAPVVGCRPVRAQGLQPRQLHALRGVGHRLAVRPARGNETSPQVGECSLRNADAEFSNPLVAERDGGGARGVRSADAVALGRVCAGRELQQAEASAADGGGAGQELAPRRWCGGEVGHVLSCGDG